MNPQRSTRETPCFQGPQASIIHLSKNAWVGAAMR